MTPRKKAIKPNIAQKFCLLAQCVYGIMSVFAKVYCRKRHQHDVLIGTSFSTLSSDFSWRVFGVCLCRYAVCFFFSLHFHSCVPCYSYFTLSLTHSFTHFSMLCVYENMVVGMYMVPLLPLLLLLLYVSPKMCCNADNLFR